MENAADALKMAAAVLIFVVALAISINAFGEVRKTSRIILDYRDREYNYEYVEQNKDDAGEISTQRLVGIETIIPSIYKAYKENYKIIFDIPGIILYEKTNSSANNGESQDINYIDLQEKELGIASEEQKRIFITAILYGSKGYNIDENKSLYGGKTWDQIKTEFRNLGIVFKNDNGLIEIIGNNKYIESLGEYYQEEVDSQVQQSGEYTPEANKTKKRIITYSNN